MLPRAPLALLCLAACASEPPADFARLLADAPRTRVERAGDSIVATAVPIERGTLPRDVAVTIDAVQPGGEVTALEQVWRDGRILYRACTSYAAPPAHVRTVLVDRGGIVVERTHEVPAASTAPDLAPALAVLARALGGALTRLEIVHGEGGGEWLRGQVGDGERIADCDLDGHLRSVRAIEWRAHGAPAGPAR